MIPLLVRQLKRDRADLEITIITSSNVYRQGKDAVPPGAEWEGIRLHKLATPGSNRVSTLQRLLAGGIFSLIAGAKALTIARPDLVLVATSPPASPLAALMLRQMRGVPYIYLIHDLYPDIAVSLNQIRAGGRGAAVCSRLQHSWLHNAARVVAIGRCMKERLVESYGLPPASVSVITNWSDPNAVVPLPRESRFRQRYGLQGFVVLYAGNFGRCQDFDTILEAARQLQTTCPEVTLALVGTGPKRPQVEAQVAESGLQNVKLMPFVEAEDFADMLASANASLVTLEPGADALGVPSKFYNILASGRPTLAVMGPTTEVARVVAEEQCGLQVDQGDVAGLVGAIAQLAGAPDQVEDMGRRAREAFERRCTLHLIAGEYAQLFDEVMAEQNGQRGSRAATV